MANKIPLTPTGGPADPESDDGELGGSQVTVSAGSDMESRELPAAASAAPSVTIGAQRGAATASFRSVAAPRRDYLLSSRYSHNRGDPRDSTPRTTYGPQVFNQAEFEALPPYFGVLPPMGASARAATPESQRDVPRMGVGALASARGPGSLASSAGTEGRSGVPGRSKDGKKSPVAKFMHKVMSFVSGASRRKTSGRHSAPEDTADEETLYRSATDENLAARPASSQSRQFRNRMPSTPSLGEGSGSEVAFGPVRRDPRAVARHWTTATTVERGAGRQSTMSAAVPMPPPFQHHPEARVDVGIGQPLTSRSPERGPPPNRTVFEYAEGRWPAGMQAPPVRPASRESLAELYGEHFAASMQRQYPGRMRMARSPAPVLMRAPHPVPFSTIWPEPGVEQQIVRQRTPRTPVVDVSTFDPQVRRRELERHLAAINEELHQIEAAEEFRSRGRLMPGRRARRDVRENLQPNVTAEQPSRGSLSPFVRAPMQANLDYHVARLAEIEAQVAARFEGRYQTLPARRAPVGNIGDDSSEGGHRRMLVPPEVRVVRRRIVAGAGPPPDPSSDDESASESSRPWRPWHEREEPVRDVGRGEREHHQGAAEGRGRPARESAEQSNRDEAVQRPARPETRRGGNRGAPHRPVHREHRDDDDGDDDGDEDPSRRLERDLTQVRDMYFHLQSG